MKQSSARAVQFLKDMFFGKFIAKKHVENFVSKCEAMAHLAIKEVYSGVQKCISTLTDTRRQEVQKIITIWSPIIRDITKAYEETKSEISIVAKDCHTALNIDPIMESNPLANAIIAEAKDIINQIKTEFNWIDEETQETETEENENSVTLTSLEIDDMVNKKIIVVGTSTMAEVVNWIGTFKSVNTSITQTARYDYVYYKMFDHKDARFCFVNNVLDDIRY